VWGATSMTHAQGLEHVMRACVSWNWWGTDVNHGCGLVAWQIYTTGGPFGAEISISTAF
jgi:hypothetical protein